MWNPRTERERERGREENRKSHEKKRGETCREKDREILKTKAKNKSITTDYEIHTMQTGFNIVNELLNPPENQFWVTDDKYNDIGCSTM